MFVETKEAGEQQPVKVGTLKISEAMRIGAKLRPQGFGRMYSHGKTCALGAAMEGRGFDPSKEDGTYRQDALHEVWFSKLGDEIVSRNDDLKQSREQIADWLEQQGY